MPRLMEDRIQDTLDGKYSVLSSVFQNALSFYLGDMFGTGQFRARAISYLVRFAAQSRRSDDVINEVERLRSLSAGEMRYELTERRVPGVCNWLRRVVYPYIGGEPPAAPFDPNAYNAMVDGLWDEGFRIARDSPF